MRLIGQTVFIVCSFFLPTGFVGVFVITKGVKMPRVSYMGDGTTTEFMFNFPYFQNTPHITVEHTHSLVYRNTIPAHHFPFQLIIVAYLHHLIPFPVYGFSTDMLPFADGVLPDGAGTDPQQTIRRLYQEIP